MRRPPIKCAGAAEPTGAGTRRGRRYRWKASNMRQKFQLPLPSLRPSGGRGANAPRFLGRTAKQAVKEPPCLTTRGAPAPFPLELPEFLLVYGVGRCCCCCSAPHAKFRLFSATFPPPDSLTQSPICRPGDWTSPFGSLGGLSPSAAPGVVGVSQDLRQGDADAQ